MNFFKKSVFGLTFLAAFAVADNPISSYHYLADPSAASDGDTFYILTDVDDYNNQTDFNYDIVGLYAFTSQDMKNWTDHGMIFRSKREFGDYPNNTWASGIAVKNGRVFIVYPNGASGVGMITAPSIDGPYTDPIKEAYGVNYIAASWGSSVIGGCDDIDHCFDPGIFFDDDGSGYVIFGGGSSNSVKRPIGNNFDIIKFSENNGKVTMDKSSLTRVSLPNSFEAPYLHKKGSTYYLSFNNKNQVIDYGMSNNIMGPYTYVGEVIPAIWQVPDAGNTGGNNHQGFAPFKDKWYAVYHDRRLVTATEHPSSCTQAGVCSTNPNKENHRSVAIDELTWSGDKMNKLTFTREGPKQIKNFDPFQKHKALTSSKQRNIRSRTDWTKGQAVKHVLTPLASKESWIRVSGVDFGSKGATSFEVEAASVKDGNKIEIRKSSVSGSLAGTCTLKNTGAWDKYATNSCDVSGLTGVVDELFLVFKGSADSTMGLLNWEFIGEQTPREPFGGKAWAVPGKIEMENFDVPGTGSANQTYSDNDAENHGDSDYRKDTGVDLYAKATGVIVGYIQKGEWLEYTINVASAGDYTVYAAVASDGGSSFKLSVDGKDVSTEVTVPPNEKKEGEEQNFDDYSKVNTNITLAAGEHVLRMTATADWFDIDYINIVPKGEPDTDPIESSSSAVEPGSSSSSEEGSAISMNVLRNSSAAVYKVYSIRGTYLGTVRLDGSLTEAMNNAGFTSGVYMLHNGFKKMMVSVTK